MMKTVDGFASMDRSEILWLFDKRIRSSVDAASAVIRELVKKLSVFDWPEKDAFAIHMATEEALMNAVKHGNAMDESKFVDVKLRLSENRFTAAISDQGDGFDPENVPDPCDETNLDKASGRGVSLIRSFVDSVSYNEVGNKIEFEKIRTASKN